MIPTFAFRGSSDQVRCVPSLNKTSLLRECNTDMEIVTTYRIAPSRKKGVLPVLHNCCSLWGTIPDAHLLRFSLLILLC